ncbi:MAG: flavodoxin-dependent (E)-4-hydroxy-3-methylbut-2-enyl-diphosphate synthase [Candidatus Eisenbacteria bacterium]|nr:flavodoxin-dependent (E)-4-hydroxy-3-methylbut-2-enyl-diphosphate synthase [Candidatus Eisenbacteria bacterium]
MLVDGIGDTIRVSLTEDSIHELPAARAILESAARQEAPPLAATIALDTRATHTRRPTAPWVLGSLAIGGDAAVRVEQAIRLGDTPQVLADLDLPTLGEEGGAEFLSLAWPGIWPELSEIESIRAALGGRGRPAPPLLLEAVIRDRADLECFDALLGAVEGASVSILAPNEAVDALVQETARRLLHHRRPLRFRLAPDQDPSQSIRWSDLARGVGLNTLGHVVAPRADWIFALRALRTGLGTREDLVFLEVPHPGPDAALLAGAALTDGLGDALSLVPSDRLPWPPSERRWRETAVESAYAILQAARLRLTKAEFIACPSCGRTMFDLQTTTARIQRRTGHLKGVKIAVMGCIVNGPGEMADADFGYVGSGPGKVDLYVGKDRVRQGVPEAEAEDRLVDLIQGHGRWIEPTAGVRHDRGEA